MALAHNQELGLSLGALAPPGILIGHRLITVGDEHALLAEEAGPFERSAVHVRRASGAARIVARALLHRLGHEMTALPKSLGGAPIWPKGVWAKAKYLPNSRASGGPAVMPISSNPNAGRLRAAWARCKPYSLHPNGGIFRT